MFGTSRTLVRLDNYIDAYRLRAQAADIHEMAARPGRRYLTEFVNERILEVVCPRSEDVLVDIGCGDGCLLRRAEGKVRQRIGIVPTLDEKHRLEPTLPGVEVIQGLCQSLPLRSSMASLVICNAVLMYLPSEDQVKSALREIARIAEPQARIWIGEVPRVDEYAVLNMYRGRRVSGLLWHSLCHDGPRALAGMMHRLARTYIGDDQVCLNSAGLFHATPENFLILAEGAGLRAQTFFPHKEVTAEGQTTDSQYRYDFIFCKTLGDC